MALVKTEVTQEIVDYLARHARQDEVLEGVWPARRQRCRAPVILATTPDEAALLTMLARLVGARRALGGRARNVHRLRGHLHRPAGARTTVGSHMLELDEEYAAIARRNLGRRGHCRPRGDRRRPRARVAARDARRADLRLDDLDLDADKPGYPDYYEEIIPRLLPGGLLLIDNVLLGGGVTDPQDERERTMDALNDRVTADERVDSVMVLIADGLTFVRRR